MELLKNLKPLQNNQQLKTIDSKYSTTKLKHLSIAATSNNCKASHAIDQIFKSKNMYYINHITLLRNI
jgi:hypothetical protein